MSVLDDLEQQIASDLSLIRRDVGSRLQPIRAALERYERAVEEQAVREYCQQHTLRRPKGTDISPDTAARLLVQSVNELPEVRLSTDMAPRAEGAPEVNSPVKAAPEDPINAQFRAKFPALCLAAESKRLLIFGAFSGRVKSLPGPLGAVCDWVDTARDGNRETSSATRRIKNGNVLGVIICDQAISHQHAEPAVAAARGAGVPVAYAGKGGNASLARAIEALEEQLE
jgi:hypothetical protein